MSSVSELGPVWLAYILAATSPGPATFLIIDQSTFVSRPHGMITAFGVSLGTAFWVVSAAFGFQKILQPLVSNGNILPILSLALLIYFGQKNLVNGIRLLRTRKNFLSLPTEKKSTNQHSFGTSTLGKRKKAFLFSQVFLKGFLINVLNPNALVFFISLFAPLMMTYANNSAKLNLTVGGVIFLSVFWYQSLALMASAGKTRTLLRRLEPYLKISFALVYAYFGWVLFRKLEF